MALAMETLERLTKATPEHAWQTLIREASTIASAPLSLANAPGEVTKRDRAIGELDHFLSLGGWELWQSFGEQVERTSDRLVRWWGEPYSAKAVLILDGLSLREMPWLLQGAEEHGCGARRVCVCVRARARARACACTCV